MDAQKIQLGGNLIPTSFVGMGMVDIVNVRNKTYWAMGSALRDMIFSYCFSLRAML
jgi:hypothetical protein